MLAVIPSAAHDLSLATFVTHAVNHPPLLAIYVACAAASIEIACHVAGAIRERKAKRVEAK